MRLYVIRHGYPNYANDTLTERGQLEADALAESLKDIPFDAIYSSTHGRAILTSLPTCHNHGIDFPILADWAREDPASDLFSKTFYDAKLKKRRREWYFWIPKERKRFISKEVLDYGDDWFNHPYFIKTTLREGVMQMRRCCDQWMISLGYKHDRVSKTYKKIKETPNCIALFAHGGFAFSFLSALLDIPYNVFTTQYGCLETTGYAIVDFEGEECKPVLVAYDKHDHLAFITK